MAAGLVGSKNVRTAIPRAYARGIRVWNRAFLLAMVSPSGDTSLVVAFIPKLTLGAFCDRLVKAKKPAAKLPAFLFNEAMVGLWV